MRSYARIRLMNILAFWFLLLQAVPAAPGPGVPDAPGVYLQQDGKNWTSLQKAAISATKADGLDLFVATGGFTDLALEAVIQGAKASVRLFTPRPMLYVRGAGSPEDLALIQLSRKKQSRTFRTSSGDSTLGNKAGFRKEDIRKLSARAYSDGTFSVIPDTDLKPGEYLLVFRDAGNSFDFGIEPKK